ncbi:MAG: hypothetical protein ACO2ZD_08360 [Pseudomonadales bacterium]|jgi:hypothetical protein
MSRRELLISVFKKHLPVTNDARKNPVELKPFALDVFWVTAFPKADIEDSMEGGMA